MENWNDIFLKSKSDIGIKSKESLMPFNKISSNKNKPELAIKLFNESFDEFNLEKSNSLISEIEKQLLLNPKESKEFKTSIRKKMNSLGILLDDLS